MISCDQAVELISAQLDEPLTAEEEAALAEHLADCPSCRALQEDFQRLHAALTQAAAHWTVEPPEELTQRIMESVHAAKAAPIAKRSWWRRRSWAALAAVLVLAVIGGSVVRLLGGGMGGSTGAAIPSNGNASSVTADMAASCETAAAPEEVESEDGASASAPERMISGGLGAANVDEDSLDSQAITGGAEMYDSGGAAEKNGADFNGELYIMPAVEQMDRAEEDEIVLALELAFRALGGDERWVREPLPGIETVGYLLTAYPEDTDAPALAVLLCADAAAEDGVYQFHYHTYTGAELTSAGQDAGYLIITVTIQGNDTNVALEESTAEAEVCTRCDEILSGNGT